MKEFLQGVWRLCVFIVLVVGMWARCEADRQRELQGSPFLQFKNKYPASPEPYKSPFRSPARDFPILPPLPKWTPADIRVPEPDVPDPLEVVPMPHAKREVAPMPREVER